MNQTNLSTNSTSRMTTTTSMISDGVLREIDLKQNDANFLESQGLPPSYERVVTGTSSLTAATAAAQSDLPPSYDSIYQRLRRAKNNSNNPYEYVNNVSSVFCSSVHVTISFAIGIALPIAMLVIGSMYKEKCPIDTKIPIWLIVSGSFGCFQIVMRTFANIIVICKKRTNPSYELKYKGIFTCLIDLFIFIWFICGNVWVYQVKSVVSYDDTAGASKYCDKTCYLFAFWIITVIWIITSFTCCCCCMLVCLFSAGSRAANQNST